MSVIGAFFSEPEISSVAVEKALSNTILLGEQTLPKNGTVSYPMNPEFPKRDVLIPAVPLADSIKS